MEPQTTSNIPDSGKCPECGEKHNDWTPYLKPEEEEVGIFCPVCYTHFKDEELSLNNFS